MNNVKKLETYVDNREKKLEKIKNTIREKTEIAQKDCRHNVLSQWKCGCQLSGYDCPGKCKYYKKANIIDYIKERGVFYMLVASIIFAFLLVCFGIYIKIK